MPHEHTNPPVDMQRDFSREIFRAEDGSTLPYRLYIPKNYDCGVMYPVLVFMHGAGERGVDNEQQINVALPHIFDDPASPAYSSIIIAPQCPEDRQWVYTPWEKGCYSVADVTESRECSAVIEILRHIVSEYNVDRSRIYVTGLSMGGFATWDLMSRHPSVFAAGMPVCGGGDPSCAKILADIPIRTFHGMLDASVPVEGTREMYAAIKALGHGRIRYKEFENGYHGIWDDVYSDEHNIRWLYSNVKRKKPKVKAAVDAVKQRTDYRKAGIAGAAALAAGALLLIHRSNRRKKDK